MRRMRWFAVEVAAVILLAGCAGGTTGTRAEAPTTPPVAVRTPSATPTVTAPEATVPVSTTPPVPGTSAPCVTAWDATAAATAEPVPLTDVRVAARDGGDRIVFEFAGDAVPAFDIAPAEPPFVHDASGLPVDVPGTAFLRIHFPFATGMDSYGGPATFAGSGGTLVSLVRTGDFEAVLTWVVGTDGPACFRMTTLEAPTRVVLDLAREG